MCVRACVRECVRALVCLRACVYISSNFKCTISGMHLSLAKQDEINNVII